MIMQNYPTVRLTPCQGGEPFFFMIFLNVGLPTNDIWKPILLQEKGYPFLYALNNCEDLDVVI